MNNILIGNALCFVGSLIMTSIGLIKKKKNFLLGQCAMNSIFIAGNLFLGGIPGAIANAASILRNLVCIKFDFTKTIKIIFIVLQLGLAYTFGTKGLAMWLPIFGNCLFTWYMDTENMVLLKAVVVLSQILWGVYDFTIMNYATVPFDIAAVITNSIAMAAILKQRKAENENTDA